MCKLQNWLERVANDAAILEAENRVREERRASRPAAVRAILSIGRKVEHFNRRARTAIGLRKRAG